MSESATNVLRGFPTDLAELNALLAESKPNIHLTYEEYGLLVCHVSLTVPPTIKAMDKLLQPAGVRLILNEAPT